jgi:hypothetical protein
MRAELEINGQIVETIIDSEALVNMISTTLRERLNVPITRPSKFRCKLANGKRVAVLGKVELEIRIDDKVIIPILVNVIESKEEMLLIGNSSLQKMKAIINYKEKTVEIENDKEIIVILIEYQLSEKNQESDSEQSEENDEYKSNNEVEAYTLFKKEFLEDEAK